MPIYDFEGKTPKIHTTVFVASTASIIGDVVIGEGSSVWPGAVIRGDFNNITIGMYTSVQDNTVIHATPRNPTKIGDHVTIGHGAIIHAAIVGNNSLIGMNAVILDGSKIGKNSIIGAGGVVVENTEIPSNSLAVGVPVKVVRTFNEASKLEARAEYSSKSYSELARRHKQEK